MIIPVNFANFEATIRKIYIDQERHVGVTLGPGSYLVNGNLEFGSKDCHVLIGRYCSLGHRLTFEVGLNHDYHQVTTYPFDDLMDKDDNKLNHSDKANHNQIIIGNDVWIGCDVTIMGGVRIGNGAVIGAGALVAKDIPPYAVVVGNPGKVIKYRFSPQIISKLQQIKWWNWSKSMIDNNLDLMKSPDKFIEKYYKEPAVIFTDVWNQLSGLRQDGWTIIGFIEDFQAEHPLGINVVREYLSSFTAEDKVIFLLEISSAVDVSRELQEITDKLQQLGELAPAMMTHTYEEGHVSEDVISCLQYLITNKEDSASQYLDYASGYSVKALFGQDDWVYKVKKGRESISLLFLGNSLTRHDQCDYWWGSWGMAASDRKFDYVHRVKCMLENKGMSVDILASNFFNWEVQNYDRAETFSLLANQLEKKPNVIVLQLGENLIDGTGIYEDFVELIQFIKTRLPDANIILVGNFWQNKDVEKKKRKAALNTGSAYVDLSDLWDDVRYICPIGTKVHSDDGTCHVVDNAGVARHPGDKGHKEIACRIIEKINLCEHDLLNGGNALDNNSNEKKIWALNDKIDAYKCNINRLMIGKKYEDVLSNISYIANVLYEYNQKYTDNDLERCLESLTKVLPIKMEQYQNHKKRRIVFYDGFGLDSRGLAQIYVLALSKLNVDLLYITIAEAKGRIPAIEAILNKCNARISYINGNSFVEKYQYICKEIGMFSADDGFLYTTPYDVSGILSFMQFSEKMTRYQINLTDHAFWLGIQAFDYCLEFRDWGSCVSHKYRKISQKKLLKQPYYPILNKDEPFAGFPFEKNKGDFVIFSGGWLYKTMDKEDTFYHLVESCLKVVPYTKFWYAGYGDDSKLICLMKRYPGRVFHTGERKDLFQLLKKVDMYLNTCPQGGGLMTQYSVIAGKPPFMLDYCGENKGLIFNQDKLGISFTIYEECEKELHRFIMDPLYRQKKEHQLKQMKTIISDIEFTSNLDTIIRKHQSKFEIKFNDVDLINQEELYAERFLQKYNKE